jgi:anti-sigma B factor antagonist
MTDQAAASILTLGIERKGDLALVRCQGRLVAEVSGNFYGRIRQLMPEHKRIVLDLGDLTQMDSMGLGSLVRLVVSAKSNGCSLELIHLGKRIRELLGMTHLLGVFTVLGEQGVTLGF